MSRFNLKHARRHSLQRKQAHLEVGDQQVFLASLAQDLAEDLDGLAPCQQEAHGHPSHTCHLNVVVHVHQLVY